MIFSEGFKKIYPFFIFSIVTFLIPSLIQAQGIKGQLRNIENEAIPYATIYTEGAQFNTTSNSEGRFFLELNPGIHKVFFQSMGFEIYQVEVTINKDYVELNPTLKEKVYLLKDIKVDASKEDPAHYIMRKAIGLRSYYESQIDSFHAKAYVKGSAILHEMPAMYRMMMDKEDRKELEQFTGKPMVVESISKVSFKQPNKYEHQVEATRSTIPSEEVDPMPMVMTSLYSERIMDTHLSPLASTAFRHYKFTYEGFFEENGRYINKIKLDPKHKGEGLFEGYLYITDELWNIHSADLKFKKEFTDIHLKQSYAPVSQAVWMPVTYDIKANISLMGVKVDVQYVVSVKEYNVSLNEKLDHSLISKDDQHSSQMTNATENQDEIKALLEEENLSKRQMRKLKKKIAKETKAAKPKRQLEIKEEEGIRIKVDSLASKKDDVYWNEIRPLPLTSHEIQSFEEKDSIQDILEGKKPETKDTILTLAQKRWRKVSNTAGGILFGKSFSKRKWNYAGLIEELSYNTVDGWRPSTSLTYRERKDRLTEYQITGRVRYAVARNRFLPSLSFTKHYAPLKRGSFILKGGRDSFDFNEKDGVNPALNTFSTLFLNRNLMKLYEKEFFNVSNQLDIANGLILSTGVEYANRRQLQNNDSLALFKWNVQPSGNEPNTVENTENNYFNSKALTISAGLQYTPFHRYRIRKGVKYMARPEYPTFNLAYKKAIPGIADSQIGYDYLSLSIEQEVELSFLHELRYLVKGGTYFNKKEMAFADFYHFRNIQLPFYFGEAFGNFRLFDYYEQSTSEGFLQANVAFNSKRLLFKRLPLLNETYLNETVFANYLYTPQMGHYTEIGYGLTEIFFFMNLEVATAIKEGKFEGVTFKLGFNFD